MKDRKRQTESVPGWVNQRPVLIFLQHQIQVPHFNSLKFLLLRVPAFLEQESCTAPRKLTLPTLRRLIVITARRRWNQRRPCPGRHGVNHRLRGFTSLLSSETRGLFLTTMPSPKMTIPDLYNPAGDLILGDPLRAWWIASACVNPRTLPWSSSTPTAWLTRGCDAISTFKIPPGLPRFFLPPRTSLHAHCTAILSIPRFETF